MQTQASLQQTVLNSEVGRTTTRPRIPLANRLPRRSVRQLYAVPLSGDDRSGTTGTEAVENDERLRGRRRMRVDIAAIPTSDRNCRHHLFVEDGTYLKKLELPSTTSVSVSQPFEARAGDTLSYYYAVVLYTTNGANADRTFVGALLVNRTAGSTVEVMHHSLEATATCQRPAAFRIRESKTITIPAPGHYQLRFTTSLDWTRPGSEAQLIVSSVRLANAYGQEIKQLASLSCVGRVRPSAR